MKGQIFSVFLQMSRSNVSKLKVRIFCRVFILYECITIDNSCHIKDEISFVLTPDFDIRIFFGITD